MPLDRKPPFNIEARIFKVLRSLPRSLEQRGGAGHNTLIQQGENMNPEVFREYDVRGLVDGT
jgi:hypothetical protein